MYHLRYPLRISLEQLLSQSQRLLYRSHDKLEGFFKAEETYKN